MARLSNKTKEEVLENPLAMSQLTAAEIDGLVMLKGAETYISNAQGSAYLHTGGHVGLAISGSGDCLAGIVSGLLARGASLEQAAVWGAFVHGAIGALLAERYGGIGFLPSEIPREIPGIINQLTRNPMAQALLNND
jgi:ADP-dependent NAD(P)H-hydrate dehydratase